MLIVHEKYRGLERYVDKYPGLDSLDGSGKFYSWWYLKDDTAWIDLYNKTGVLNGRKKKIYQDTLNRVLTNLYKTPRKPIIYSRDKKYFAPGTFYYNEELTYTIMKNCIDALCELELIDHGIGDNGFNKYSYFRATEELQEVFKGLTIKNSNINYALTRTIYLRDKKKEDGTNGKLLPVDYTTKQNITLNNHLVKYNSFIALFDITWDAPEVAKLLHKCLLWRDKPELIKKRSLHSIFNENMSNGGRMYGAFWINMPKMLRPYLKINGESLVDIDFNACHIQLLYKKVGEPTPKNPYVYDRSDIRRDYAKRLLLTTLNLKMKGERTENQVRNDVYRASEIREEKHYMLKEILVKLEKAHEPIKKYFYTGIGLRLQLAEANIMRRIMKKCMKKNIPILPVHDGCSVRISNADKVEKIFKETTDIPFNRDILKSNTNKIGDRIEKWIRTNPLDPRLEEITAKFNKILKEES